VKAAWAAQAIQAVHATEAEQEAQEAWSVRTEQGATKVTRGALSTQADNWHGQHRLNKGYKKN